MRLTKFTDNSLRVLIYVALAPDRRVNITELAKECGVPRNHLAKVIHAMAIGGLLDTKRGKGGGVMLSRPANEIIVGDVVRLMESDLPLIDCNNPPCPLLPRCKLRGILGEAQQALYGVLDDCTVEDLLDK